MSFAMRAALIQIRDKLKRRVDDEIDCYDLACNALATDVDAKYTEDEMQQMVADLADIELGAVRGTTPGMAAEAIAQLLAGLVKPAAPVKFGCHCDKDPDVEADGCVIDTGDRADCVFASRNNNALKRKEDCEYWLPVKMVDASPALPKTESNGTLVGCEDEGGLLHIHPESESCAICRPQVGSSATAVMACPDVDWLSNIIRAADGNHTLGAGALAEKIVEAIAAKAVLMNSKGIEHAEQ
jgi:hypothetical protein